MNRFYPLLLLCLCPLFSFAQDRIKPAEPETLLKSMAAKTFTDTAGTTLPYRLLVPEAAGEKLPLFLAMHGAGGRGDDNAKTIKHSPWALHTMTAESVQKANPCIVLAPQCPNGKRWVDVDWNKCIYSSEEVAITAELTAVVELLKATIKETGADPTRVYVGGFSMGGYGTWDLIGRFPELFAAAVPVCGGAPTDTAKAMKDVAVWAFHGDKDTVVPPKGTEAMVEALKKAGGAPTYTVFEGVGHNAWTPAWTKPDLVKWLFEQKKATPDETEQ